jgi:hypothetical protein
LFGFWGALEGAGFREKSEFLERKKFMIATFHVIVTEQLFYILDQHSMNMIELSKLLIFFLC